MSNVRVAWTIFKLNVVRALLKPLLKLHIWYLTRGENDLDRLDKHVDWLMDELDK